jgi:hypothetical protein
MTIRMTIIAAAMAAISAPALAGGFVALPDSAPLRVLGANNSAADQLFLGDGWTPETNGYTRVARRISSVLYDGNDIGLFQDYVYRDNIDGTLLFASQFTLEVEEQNGYVLEINDIFRRGFTGYDVSVGWYDADLGSRLVSAAHSSVGRTRPQQADIYSEDTVNLRTDISIEEENPSTAWYVIKTDATQFSYLMNGVSVTQAASTNGLEPPFRAATFEAFAPVPVPEPAEYMMLLGGLGLVGVVVSRRRAK